MSATKPKCGYRFSGGLKCQLEPGHRSKFHQWEDATLLVKFVPYTAKQLAARERAKVRATKKRESAGRKKSYE